MNLQLCFGNLFFHHRIARLQNLSEISTDGLPPPQTLWISCHLDRRRGAPERRDLNPDDNQHKTNNI